MPAYSILQIGRHSKDKLIFHAFFEKMTCQICIRRVLSFEYQEDNLFLALTCRNWKAMLSCPWARKSCIHNWIQYFMIKAFDRRTLRDTRIVVFASDENHRFVVDQLGINRPERFRVINHGVNHIQFNPIIRKDLVGNRLRHIPEMDPHTR